MSPLGSFIGLEMASFEMAVFETTLDAPKLLDATAATPTSKTTPNVTVTIVFL